MFEFMPDYMPIITALVVIGSVSVALVTLCGGTEQGHRSMESVYARRGRKLGAGDDSSSGS